GGGRALVQVEQGPFRRTLFAFLAFLARVEFKHAVFRPNWCSASLNAPARSTISETAVYLEAFSRPPGPRLDIPPPNLIKNTRRSGTWNERAAARFFVRPDRR